LFEQREGGGGARNKLQVKSYNDRGFTGILIAVEKGERSKNMNSVLRYQELYRRREKGKDVGLAARSQLLVQR